MNQYLEVRDNETDIFFITVAKDLSGGQIFFTGDYLKLAVSIAEVMRTKPQIKEMILKSVECYNELIK